MFRFVSTVVTVLAIYFVLTNVNAVDEGNGLIRAVVGIKTNVHER